MLPNLAVTSEVNGVERKGGQAREGVNSPVMTAATV